MMYGDLPLASVPLGATSTGLVVGDPLRLAFRDRLVVWMSDLGIAWSIRDLTNAGDNPDVSQGFIALDFPGGQVDAQYTFGAPGWNLWIEEGQVTLYIKTRLGAGIALRNQAELYGAQLRSRFRGDRFVAGAVTVQITGTAAMGGGQDEGGLWVEAVGLAYRVFNVG
jgi:hypothetical protein